jgi:DNA repair ATPase RecN
LWKFDLRFQYVYAQARKTFLQQDNELAEMRQRVQSRSDFLGELRMQTKELSANVEDRREQLCVKIRTLTVADKTAGAAQSKLQVLSCADEIEKWLHFFPFSLY